MQVNIAYLKRFGVPITEAPTKINLSTWESDPQNVISIDDADNHHISFEYFDEWDANEPWDIKDGVEKRWTFVRLHKDNEIVGKVGWEFRGLIDKADLRGWMRAKLGVKDNENNG